MNAYALDQLGVPIDIAFYKPIARSNSTKSSGQSHRVSFEVSKESFDMLSNIKDFPRLVLQARLTLVDYDNAVVGGYYSNVAGTICRDPAFHHYLQTKATLKGVDIEQGETFALFRNLKPSKQWEAYSRQWLCQYCKVTSRKDIDHSELARDQFRKLSRDVRRHCSTHNMNCAYLAVVKD